MLPWPGPRERQAAIRAARREKERSQAGAREAVGLEAQIWRLKRENHFAARIIDDIITGYEERGGR